MERGDGTEALGRPSCFGVSVCRAGQSTGRPERCQAKMTARSGSLPRAGRLGKTPGGAVCSAHRETPQRAPAERPWPASASTPLCWCLPWPPPLLSLWALPTDGLPPPSDPRPRPLLPAQGGVPCSTCQWAGVVGLEGDGLEDLLLVSRWSACLPARLPWICSTSACQSNRLFVFRKFLFIYLACAVRLAGS